MRLASSHLEHTDSRFISILEETEKPMGRVLVEERVPFDKEALEIATEIKDNKQFQFPIEGGTPLARRYRLSHREDGLWVIKGAVVEVFSPELLRLKR